MSDQFLSEPNFRYLNSMVQNVYGNNIDYSKDLIESIEYVYSNVSPNPPKGMSIDKYVFLMNKKVINILKPRLNKKKQEVIVQSNELNKPKSINLNPVQISSTNLSNNSYDHVFDPSKTIHNELNVNTMDPPKPQGISNSSETMNQELNKLQNTRDQLMPKAENIDFSLDNQNDKLERPDILYNDIVKKREKQNFFDVQKRFENFDNHNNNINQNNITLTLQREENNNNIAQSTPLGEILKKQNNLQGQQILDRPDFSAPINNTINTMSTPLAANNNNQQLFNRQSTPLLNNNDTQSSYTKKLEEFVNPIHSIPENLNTRAQSVLLQPKIPLKKFDYYITVDSQDRDLAIYPNPSNFQVKFSPSSNGIEVGNIIDKDNNLIIEGKTLYFGDDNGASINITYDNIYEIECIAVTVPLSVKYVAGSMPLSYNKGSLAGINNNNPDVLTGRFGPFWQKYNGAPVNILSSPYILLNIDQLKGPYEGTNKYLSKAFAKLIPKLVTNNNVFPNTNNSHFMELNPSGPHEIYKYDPTNLGSLSKMNLQLLTKTGEFYNFGIDKYFIENISSSTYPKTTIGQCINESVYTKITLQNQHPSYCDLCVALENSYDICTACQSITNNDISAIKSGKILNQHNLQIGDLIYFYDTTPDVKNVLFFHNNVTIDESDYCNINYDCINNNCNEKEDEYLPIDEVNTNVITNVDILNKYNLGSKQLVYISLKVKCENKINENETETTFKNIDFSNIFPQIYKEFNYVYLTESIRMLKYSDVYLYLSYVSNNQTTTEFCKVYGFQNNGIIIEAPSNYDTSDFNVLKIGYANNNARGSQSDNPRSLFYKGGHRVLFMGNPIQLDTSDNVIHIDTTGNNWDIVLDLPYKFIPDYLREDNYNANDIFMIQNKMQTSFTFRITSMIRDTKELDTRWQ